MLRRKSSQLCCCNTPLVTATSKMSAHAAVRPFPSLAGFASCQLSSTVVISLVAPSCCCSFPSWFALAARRGCQLGLTAVVRGYHGRLHLDFAAIIFAVLRARRCSFPFACLAIILRCCEHGVARLFPLAGLAPILRYCEHAVVHSLLPAWHWWCNTPMLSVASATRRCSFPISMVSPDVCVCVFLVPVPTAHRRSCEGLAQLTRLV